MKVLYTQGTYDLFHAGHVQFLKRCRSIADLVIVHLLSDEAIKEYRGKYPIIKYEDRKSVLESCVYVGRVVKSDPKNTAAEIEKYNPDFVAIGTDWALKDIYKQYRMSKKILDKKLLFFPYTPRISSTEIKERIKNE